MHFGTLLLFQTFHIHRPVRRKDAHQQDGMEDGQSKKADGQGFLSAQERDHPADYHVDDGNPEDPGCVLGGKVFGVGIALPQDTAEGAGNHPDRHEKTREIHQGEQAGEGKQHLAEIARQLGAGKQGTDGRGQGQDTERDKQGDDRPPPPALAERLSEIGEHEHRAEEGRGQDEHQPQLQDGVGIGGHEHRRAHQDVGEETGDDRLPRRIVIVHVAGIGLTAVSPAHIGHKNAGGHEDRQRRGKKNVPDGVKHAGTKIIIFRGWQTGQKGRQARTAGPP